MIPILYLHNHSDISGGEQSLLNLWRAMDRIVYAPYLMIPAEGPLSAEAQKNGVFVDFHSIPQLRPINAVAIIKSCIHLALICRRNNIRIIHSYSPRNNILASCIGKLLGIPVIWHERNMIFGNEQDISRLFHFLPDRIICNSQAVAERFRKSNRVHPKVAVIINGVDPARFRITPPLPAIKRHYNPHNKKIIGLISNLSVRKGTHLFIAIAGQVISRYANVHFLIVGGAFGDNSGSQKSALLQQINDAGLSNAVTITGFVANVHEILPLFDIGVAVTEKEACSRAILEMMACGKPVVAFATGGTGELIVHNQTGLLFPYNEIDAAAQGLIDLLNNNEKSAFLGTMGRKRVETSLNAARNAQKTMALYSELYRENAS